MRLDATLMNVKSANSTLAGILQFESASLGVAQLDTSARVFLICADVFALNEKTRGRVRVRIRTEITKGWHTGERPFSRWHNKKYPRTLDRRTFDLLEVLLGHRRVAISCELRRISGWKATQSSTAEFTFLHRVKLTHPHRARIHR